VIVTDANYNILRWNEVAERLYGWKQEEVLGKYVGAIISTEFVATTASEASELLRSRGYWKGPRIAQRAAKKERASIKCASLRRKNKTLSRKRGTYDQYR